MTQDCAILIPAYNSVSTVVETLQSIRSQRGGLNRLEAVILADDASTDQTPTVAREAWNCLSPELRVMRNPANCGERMTLNRAAEALPSNVEWFFIIHADDLAKPNWLEVMLRAADAATLNTVALTASYDVLFADGTIQVGENFGEEQKVHIAGTSDAVRDTLVRGCWFKISSCAMRLSAFRELGGFRADLPQFGDWEFVLRLLRRGYSIDYLPLCLSVYRQLPQSVSSVSFQLHRDIREALGIVAEYEKFLTRAELAKRHLWYLYLLARRSGASILSRDLHRFVKGLGLVPAVAANWWRCATVSDRINS